jgi:hypothetical protein
VAATRTYWFRAEADLGDRHDRALAELDRLRRERPPLAASVRYDFDVRLAEAQRHGLTSPGERLRATVQALIGAVEAALDDEQLIDVGDGQPGDDALAAARAAAEASASRYERKPPAARTDLTG